MLLGPAIILRQIGDGLSRLLRGSPSFHRRGRRSRRPGRTSPHRSLLVRLGVSMAVVVPAALGQVSATPAPLAVSARPLAVDLPASAALKVVQTQAAVRGDTRTNVMKPATLETGHVVQVPLFVEEGERIKVDTRTGNYIERVK